jgi:Nucleotidyl transferase AbiEii toxin, Type IV TA system
MAETTEIKFDERVVSAILVKFCRELQGRQPAQLAGGAALSGVFLHHRLSDDIDLFFRDNSEHRELIAQLPQIASILNVKIQIVRDAGTFVRAQLEQPGCKYIVDLVVDTVANIDPPGALVEGVVVQSLADLRANKITCLLSRSEPRDLVDLYFLERQGFRVEDDLKGALQKDAGVDPGILAYLLREFPVEPLPMMLEPLTVLQLRAFRDELSERLRSLAVQALP